MKQSLSCSANLFSAFVICLLGPLLASSPLNNLLSWLLEMMIQVQIPKCIMHGIVFLSYAATAIPVALLFLLFAFMSMSLNDLPNKTKRVVSLIFHIMPISYFILIPCLMITGIVKTDAPIQILYIGYHPYGNSNHFTFQGERVFDKDIIEHAMMIILFGAIPYSITCLVAGRYNKNAETETNTKDATP